MTFFTQLGLKSGAGPAVKRLDEYGHALHNKATQEQFAGGDGLKTQIASEFCGVLCKMVNSDARLSDDQLESIHAPLRMAVGNFQRDNFTKGEDVQDVGSVYLLSLAQYINSCKG